MLAMRSPRVERLSLALPRRIWHVCTLTTSYDLTRRKVNPSRRLRGRNPSRTRRPLVPADAALWLAWALGAAPRPRPLPLTLPIAGRG